jgi:F0F1-type ATP synthase membrane subunit c/vacuolar-type H+-ATPase subunit K
MDSSILWVLVIAWAISCGYYAIKLLRIARGKGVSVFSLIARSKKSNHSRTRKLFLNIIIATVLFLISILIAFFVNFSS